MKKKSNEEIAFSLELPENFSREKERERKRKKEKESEKTTDKQNKVTSTANGEV